MMVRMYEYDWDAPVQEKLIRSNITLDDIPLGEEYYKAFNELDRYGRYWIQREGVLYLIMTNK